MRREPDHVHQHQHIALPPAKSRERILERPPGIFVGSGAARRPIVRVEQHCSPPPPQAVERGVARHAQEPGREVPAHRIASAGGHQLEEDLLRQVLRLVPVPHYVADVAVDPG